MVGVDHLARGLMQLGSQFDAFLEVELPIRFNVEMLKINFEALNAIRFRLDGAIADGTHRSGSRDDEPAGGVPHYYVPTFAKGGEPHYTPDGEPLCEQCGSLPLPGLAMQRCGRCHAVCYCSRDCQLQGWKRGHKKVCGLAVACAL
mmetsp:Transcript_17940/g.45962  ORF Transcript_17940/g.45962 Transcript_17940/m.45962 type:complete len:146 (+) Transcript_17940:836-1273(+)